MTPHQETALGESGEIASDIVHVVGYLSARAAGSDD